jgi:hypothetical protein
MLSKVSMATRINFTKATISTLPLPNWANVILIPTLKQQGYNFVLLPMALELSPFIGELKAGALNAFCWNASLI